MSSYTSISVEKLSRLIGTTTTPVLIDVRTADDFAADPSIIPGALRRSHEAAADWATSFSDRSVIVICQKGLKLSEGSAAWLQHAGATAETLDGGFEAWKAAKLPTVPVAELPSPDAQGRTACGHKVTTQDRPHRMSVAAGDNCLQVWADGNRIVMRRDADDNYPIEGTLEKPTDQVKPAPGGYR
jgi:rhodanese-related sulfurtransferase